MTADVGAPLFETPLSRLVRTDAARGVQMLITPEALAKRRRLCASVSRSGEIGPRAHGPPPRLKVSRELSIGYTPPRMVAPPSATMV